MGYRWVAGADSRTAGGWGQPGRCWQSWIASGLRRHQELDRKSLGGVGLAGASAVRPVRGWWFTDACVGMCAAWDVACWSVRVDHRVVGLGWVVSPFLHGAGAHDYIHP